MTLKKVRRIFVNVNESLTQWELNRVCARYSAAVYPKMRLKDVVDVESQGFDSEAVRFGLMAHLDYVVTDQASGEALFAVEFDGPSHETEDAKRRDALKDSICRASEFPLLRINELHLRLVRDNSLLYWMTELWFMNRDWDLKGLNDDPDPDSWAFEAVYSILEDATGDYPYDLTRAADPVISEASKKGLLRSLAPFLITPTVDAVAGSDFVCAYAVLALTNGAYLIGQHAVRKYEFPPISAFELSRSLAHLDVAERLSAFMKRRVVPSSYEQVSALVRSHRDWKMDGGVLPVPGGVLSLNGEFHATAAWGT